MVQSAGEATRVRINATQLAMLRDGVTLKNTACRKQYRLSVQ